MVDYEELYLVSDDGRVKSQRTGRILANRSIKGYSYVALYRDGQRKECPVHVLMLEAFVGPCPPGMETFHVNDVQWDNRIENLRWDTHSENMLNTFRVRRLSEAERIALLRQGV